MIYLVMTGALLWEINHLMPYLKSKGYPYSVISPGDIVHGRIAINVLEDVVIGPVESLHLVWSRNNIPIPDSNHYPEELSMLLHRKVDRALLKDLSEDFLGFVKPVKLKLFDGEVIQSSDDIKELSCYPEDTELYVSEVVRFISEWRYYVIDGKIRARGNYLGDESIEPDITKVDLAVKALEGKYKNYCLDFGVLDTGETALVELTDGYSIGWYPEEGIDLYFELLNNRWREIVKAGGKKDDEAMEG